MLGKTLLACATFIVAAVAQASSSQIAFTSLPASVTAGQPVNLTWEGGDGSPVTITLQQGLPSNLQTVSVITGNAVGYSYVWTPSTSLPDASNYALKIEQGDNTPNYTGMITLSGGSTSGPTNAVSAISFSTTSSGSTSSATVNPASGGVVGGAGSGANVTSTATANATTTVATGKGTSARAGATGTAISRNFTMSKATLSSTFSSTAAASSSAAASTSSTSGSGTTTSSSTSSTSTSKSGAVQLAASNFALLCAAVVGVYYLG